MHAGSQKRYMPLADSSWVALPIYSSEAPSRPSHTSEERADTLELADSPGVEASRTDLRGTSQSTNDHPRRRGSTPSARIFRCPGGSARRPETPRQSRLRGLAGAIDGTASIFTSCRATAVACFNTTRMSQRHFAAGSMPSSTMSGAEWSGLPPRPWCGSKVERGSTTLSLI